MIKLFWNTHNQIKPSENKEKSEDSLNYIWGMYHQKNSNKWVNKVLKKKHISNDMFKNGREERVIADFIAGMTDRYAINLHEKIK